MNWRFWKPKQTVQSVAKQLLDGLRDGSIVVGEPLAQEPLDEPGSADESATSSTDAAQADRAE